LITGAVDRCVKAWFVSRPSSASTFTTHHASSSSSSSSSESSGSGHIQFLWSQRAAFEDRVLAVHANTEYVAAASQDRRICVYSITDGTKVTSLQLDKDHATCVRLTPIQSKNHKGEIQRNKRQFMACGTAYRKVFVYEICLGNQQNKEPVLIRSIVIAHTRVISLQFVNECDSSWQPTSSSSGGRSGKDKDDDDNNRVNLRDHSNGPEEVLAAAPERKPRLRRSSLGPCSLTPLLSLSHHSSMMNDRTTTTTTTTTTVNNAAPTTTSSVNMFVGSHGGSDEQNRSFDGSNSHHNNASNSTTSSAINDIDQSLVMGLKDGSVLQWDWSSPSQPLRGLVTPDGLAPELSSITLLAIPLSGSTVLDPASLIRCTLVVQLFQVVVRFSSGGSIEGIKRRQSPAQLLSVVARLTQEVRVIEEREVDQAARRTAALDAEQGNRPRSYRQNKTSESALPGLETFKGRLEDAIERADSNAEALVNMQAEFEQHLHHLLTFPSLSLCNMLELDLVNGQVFCATTNGLNRRPLLKPSNHKKSPRSFMWPKVEQPYLHSDMEPHIPCYQIKVLPSEKVVFSVGKDRLLRCWDMNSGTAIRCLPSVSSDVPVAASNGVVASVEGQRAESIRAWAVWG
jgi:hypothetical protein